MIEPIDKAEFELLRRSTYVDYTESLYWVIRSWACEGRLPFVHYDAINATQLPNEVDDLLCKLLGYSSVYDLVVNWDERRAQIAETLCGPHGWTIYKALEARGFK